MPLPLSGPAPTATQPASVVADVTIVMQSQFGGRAQAGEAVVRDERGWQALWEARGGVGTAPAVDFSRQMLVAIDLGTRPTGGYAVRVTGTALTDDAIELRYVEQRPSPDAMVAQVMTAPFIVAMVPARPQLRFIALRETAAPPPPTPAAAR